MKSNRLPSSRKSKIAGAANATFAAATLIVCSNSHIGAATLNYTTAGDFAAAATYGGTAPATSGDTITAIGSFSITHAAGYASEYSLATLNLNVASGAGTFNQTGGTLGIGTLNFGGAGASRNPTYNLDGGILNITTGFVWGNGSNARFNVNGGTANYSGTSLSIGIAGGARGSINMTGGTFNANSVGQINLANTSNGDAQASVVLSGDARFNATAATLVLGQFGAASGTSTFATLTMSGTSSVTAANVVLGGNNAGSAVYGVINLNGGTISAGSIRKGSSTIAASATTQVLNADGGTLKATTHANNADFLAGTFVNLKTGGLKFDTNGNSVGISNVMSGSGGLTKQGSGALTLSQKSTYTGGTTVDDGTLVLGSGGNIGTIRGALTINSGATVSTTTVDALGYDAGLNVSSIIINGGTLNNATTGNQGFRTAVSLTGGSITSTGGGAFNFSGGFGIASTASATTSTISAPVALRGASMDITTAQGTTVSGVDLAISGAIGQAIEAGSYGITKKGSGTLSLSGNNTYSGATTVEAGVLALAVGGSIANSSTIDVKAGAILDASARNGWSLATGQTLKGTGTVKVGASNALNVASGATLAPGSSPGTLSLTGNLDFADSSTFAVELETSNAPTSDRVNVSGDLTIASGAILSIGLFGSDMTLPEGTRFVLIDYSGTWTAGNEFGNAADGSYNNFGTLNTYYVDYNDPSLGGTALTLTVIPEPAQMGLAIVGTLALLLPRRRSHR